MKNTKRLIIAGAAIFILLAIYLFFFNRKQTTVPFNPAFTAHITAYTSGNISKESPVRIQLAREISKEEIEKLDDMQLFEFSPDIKGKTVWQDGYTVDFIPEAPLPSGKSYEVEFALGKTSHVTPDLKTFTFSFQVIKQSFDVVVDGLKSVDKMKPGQQRMFGSIITADAENPEKIKKVLEAKQDNTILPIRWESDGGRRKFSFVVDSIVRGEQASIVKLTWNGKAIDVNSKNSQEVIVPAIGDFSLINHKVFYNPEQYLLLQFSGSLLESQNLDGLIRIGQLTNLRFVILDNEIRVYAPQQLIGEQEVFVDMAIQNNQKGKLRETIRFTTSFEEILPAVRLTNSGVILPNTGKLAFPFETVNLRAVDVKVIKIYENNIKQFLQINPMDGNYELRRVGKVVATKTIALDDDKLLDLSIWNRFSLDLNELIKAEPGAIYQITIGFNHAYSLFGCQDKPGDKNEDTADEDSGYYDDEYYDEYDSYFYPRGYDWEQRDNPCDVSYYTSSRWVTKNILASDLGLIAKKGSGDNMLFIVNDLKTTKPLTNVTLEVYDYQQQLIAQGRTNSDGIAYVSVKSEPYLLIASDGSQKGYLRLDDGSSLSLSKFDISGENTQEGIKGFIYGERGVWRPGDTLFMMFMLEDRLKTIPVNHPVSFELFNPLGQLVDKIIQTESVNGIYDFQTSTSSDAPTGVWNVKVKVGGATFQKSIRIETILPNRLKLNLDFGGAFYKDQSVTGILQANWLHGAIAKNLKTTIEVTLSGAKTIFKKFPAYRFDDPSRRFESEKKIIFDGEIDETGKAKITPEFRTGDAPGMLNAVFVTRVFEPGGNFSIDKFTIPYYPYHTFIGLQMPDAEKTNATILTNTNHKIKIVAVDQQGNLTSKCKIVDVELYKIEWRWWWDQSDDDLTNYNTSGYHKPIKRERITLTDGQGEYNLRINYPEWGRYLIRICDETGGHCTGQSFYVDWGGEYAHAAKDQPGGATMLSFTSDKTNYLVGENVKLTIPTGDKGRALVSIENGSRVLQTNWVDVKSGQTEFSFKATQEMTPNIFVHVTLLQPHAQTLNDLPIRMYGIIPVTVEDPTTKLQPVISMKEVLRPEEKSTITVSEKNGTEMTYTIAIVDEGLLDLTRFKTPDPWTSFNAKEALGVKSWDLYDDVIGAWSAQLERMFSIGGDDYNRPKDDRKAKRFKPVVISLGPFHLKKGAKQTHEFIMPQYVGSVRAMVVSAYNGAYGSAEKTIPVRKPLMILATLPRVIGPGETVSLPVNVFAMEKNVNEVNVEVQANEFFTVEGEKQKNIRFTEAGDKIVVFNLKVKPVLGIGKVKIIAKSGNETAEYSVEIDVRNPNPSITDVIDTIIGAGQKIAIPFKPLGMTGTNSGMVEVSSFPPVNLGKRLDYLVRYPFGCVEQTTSAVFPQLFLNQFVELSPEKKTEIESNIKAGIQRLSTFQIPDGGMTYWPGNTQADEWSTSYAGHFMIEAQLLGYNLPPSYMEQWKRFQRSKATNWNLGASERSTLIQAYRLYTLALAKAPELGAMNRLREQKDLPTETLWCLASAYQLAGQPEVARALTATIGTTVTRYSEPGSSYGSDLRDKAMILEALVLIGENTKAAPLMKEIAERLSSYEWLSTQTTAYSLIAVAKFIQKNGISDNLNFTCRINNTSNEVNTNSPFSQIDIPIRNTESGKVEIVNTSKGVLFARIILTGQPESGDSKGTKENNLKINVTYKTLEGKLLDVSKLQQGTDFMAEVTVFNPGMRGNYQQMALTQIFPSGWEIHNTRLFGIEGGLTSSPFTYQDIRDDRVYTYFDINKNQSLTYYVLLNASYTGRFFLPSTNCAAMYDASINARVPGKWVEVTE
jgi:uncharacterized protein YfaS (alpha-2-macroglobulin family)